ncbi:MAG: GNAT family N-acetyltransferase [Prosthecobacter sp.]|nr:GNAT family N-acetyltransferase [Prosthecobacter sp.]
MLPDEDPNPELDIDELSPLLQMIAPKIICCRIHEYQPEDFEACVDIHRSNQPDFLKPDSLQAFVEFLQLGTSYFLVVEHEGETVACGGLELVGDSDSATLVHLMVHGDYQRRGYGSTLLTACIALLDQEDRPFDLWVNTPRAGTFFYRQYGFRQHPVSPDSPLFDRDSRHGDEAEDDDRPIMDRQRAALWLSINPQDIEDARALLEERSIRIELEDAVDLAEAEAAAEEEEE